MTVIRAGVLAAGRMQPRQHLGLEWNFTDARRYLTVAVMSTLLLGGSADRSRGAETNDDLGPTTLIATRAEDVP